MNAHGSSNHFHLRWRYYFSDIALVLFIFGGNEVEAKANHIIALIDGYFISADVWHLKDDDIGSEWGLNLINAGEDDITLSGCSVLV